MKTEENNPAWAHESAVPFYVCSQYFIQRCLLRVELFYFWFNSTLTKTMILLILQHMRAFAWLRLIEMLKRCTSAFSKCKNEPQGDYVNSLPRRENNLNLTWPEFHSLPPSLHTFTGVTPSILYVGCHSFCRWLKCIVTSACDTFVESIEAMGRMRMLLQREVK